MPTRPSSKRETPILLATGNPAKQQTLRWLLEGLDLRPTTPEQLGLESVPEEEGDTHQAIARLKAQEWSLAGSTLAIASDGGLVLPALGAGKGSAPMKTPRLNRSGPPRYGQLTLPAE